MDEAAPKVGLRERKKTATRELIVQVANREFRNRGFDAVTLDQIADECVMSKRTILRYFNTKEALALAPEREALARFETAVRTRQTDAATCWREFVAETVRQMTVNSRESRRRMALTMAHPALYAEFIRIGRAYEDVLAAAIDEETKGTDPLGSRLHATILVAGMSATFREWINNKDLDLHVLLDVVDYAAAAFHPEQVNNSWARHRRHRSPARR
jgi:AcrR family transcriptional regulator